jgi:hypothetical protein
LMYVLEKIRLLRGSTQLTGGENTEENIEESI